MTSTAVNVLVIDPIMYCVSSVGAVVGSSRAEPTCRDHTSVPSLTTPALTAGECHWTLRLAHLALEVAHQSVSQRQVTR